LLADLVRLWKNDQLVEKIDRLRHIRSAVAGILPVGVSFLLAVYLSIVS
jgi:hypothetical protein